MGKVVKYCANCEESFAEKFAFCPNCAAALTAYEMNPLAASQAAEPVKVEEPVKAAPVPKPVVAEKKEDFKAQTEPQPVSNFSADTSDDILDVNERVADPETETVVSQPKPVGGKNTPITILPAAVSSANVAPSNVDDYNRTYKANGNGNARSTDSKATSNGNSVKKEFNAPIKPSSKTYSDGGYNITFVEEKNNGTRRGLLAGAFLLVLVTAVSGLVFSLYTSDALVGSVGDDFALNAPVDITEPPAEEPLEPEPPKAPSKKDAGGGGGGGKNEQTETSKGQLAPQMEKPLIAPSVTMDKVTKPAIAIQMATQGKANIPQTDEKYGNPNSLSTIPSDGTGSGGGQGSGIGRGQGSGRGTGAGSGIGSGLGNGIGNGIGDGEGDGVGGPPAIKKPEPAGPTVAIQITSKPRANYTDAARQAQVQGTVSLRVTFLANGSIGSISTVSGLPNGLTEQAIAAARGMRFEPAKKGGVPYTVTKVVQYNFTLY
jgi:TonB family protein